MIRDKKIVSELFKGVTLVCDPYLTSVWSNRYKSENAT